MAATLRMEPKHPGFYTEYPVLYTLDKNLELCSIASLKAHLNVATIFPFNFSFQ